MTKHLVVSEQDADAARLVIELNDELGIETDPALRSIAKAEWADERAEAEVAATVRLRLGGHGSLTGMDVSDQAQNPGMASPPRRPADAAMPFDAHVLRVLIASPSDTGEERDAVQRALHGWNADRAAREQVILLPRRYETDAVPRLGDSAQGIINEQLVKDADIVIALFDSRLGMATPTDVSGTAEEIRRSHEAGKPVHVWFSDEPIPRDADVKQLQQLNEFKDTLQSLGLLGTYANPDDLAYKVRQAIESDLDHLNLGSVQRRESVQNHAVLRAEYREDREQYEDNKGRVKVRTRGERLVVRNIGTVTATAVKVELRSLDELHPPPQLRNENVRPNVVPQSEFPWPLITFMESAQELEVVMTWTEGEEERTETQHVAAISG